MLTKLSGLIRAKHAAKPTHRFVEKVVSSLGESITEAKNFEPILVGALHSAEAYYHRQIQAIPGPFRISTKPANDNPFVQAVFPDRESVITALGRSIEVRDFLPALAKDGKTHVVGLLGAREKASREESGRLEFADHTIRSIGHSEEYCRDSLRNSCLHRLLGEFRDHTDILRKRERLLKSEWNIESSVTSSAQPTGNSAPEFVFATKELQPDNILKGLVAWLETPENHLRIESSNVLISGPGAPTSELPVMRCTDRRHWTVSLVEIPVQEAMDALASESRCHRYIFI